MITSMRQALRKPLIKDIVVWGMIISLSLFYTVPELIKRLSTPEGIITVDGVNIMTEEFQAEVNRQQRKITMLYNQYGPTAKYILQISGLSENPTEMAYRILVRQALLNSIAKKYDIVVNVDLINQEVGRMLPEGAFSNGKLNIPLEFVEELKSVLKNELKGKIVLDFVDASVFIPEFEVRAKFIEQYSKKNYSILTFSFDNYLNDVKAKKITREELAKYYSNNKAKYLVGEKRDGQIWYFDADKFDIKLSDEDVKNYYNRNKPKFKDKDAEVKVAHILIKNAPDALKTANELQKKLALDPASFDGEELDYFKRGEKDSDFENGAFDLNKENPISSVIATQDGYEIIKFIDKKHATFKPLKAVEGDIKSTLKNERFKKLFPLSAKKTMHAKDKVVELAKLKEKGVQGQAIVNMSKSEIKDIKKLFSLKAVGEFDFFMDGDRGVIIQLDKISKSYQPALSDIENKVEADYYEEAAKSMLKADLNKAYNEAKEKSLDAIKNKFKFASIRFVDNVSPQDRIVMNTLSKQSLPIFKMANLQIVGAIISDLSEKDGFLVKLTNISEFDQKLFDEKKIELKQLLSQERKQMITESFIASLKKNAKISINDDRLKNQLKDLL